VHWVNPYLLLEIMILRKSNLINIDAVGISGNSSRLKTNKLDEMAETISNIVSKYSIVY
jgi:hypothetical protein